MTVEYLKESNENVGNEKILWLVTKRKRFHLVIITITVEFYNNQDKTIMLFAGSMISYALFVAHI